MSTLKNSKEIISANNTIAKLPIFESITIYLLYLKFPNPQWLWGIVGFIFFIYWILGIVAIYMYKPIDIFERFKSIEEKLNLLINHHS